MIQKIHDIATQLEAVYPKDEAEGLAWWMAEELSGLSRTQLQFGCKDTTFLRNTQTIIDRLLHFEPIQYIFGHTLWCGLDLKVTPATLIPRPETAELVERIDRLRLTEHRPSSTDRIQTDNAPLRVLDIGTGSGCIAIALKKRHPEWEVTGIDISKEAIEEAKENARRNGVEVEFREADIFHLPFAIAHLPFDVVVSNPPYICNKEKGEMRRNVVDYEPHTALFVPDEDPLLFYRRIAELCAGQQKEVQVFFEINENLSDEIEDLLHSFGFSDVRITRDMYGKPRVAEGCLIAEKKA